MQGKVNQFALGTRSLSKLKGVHPDLVAVVKRAITLSTVDFVIYDGVRTLDQQRLYVASGASWTLKSRHLTGHAIDIAPCIGKDIRWDWPLFHFLAGAMKLAAKDLSIKIDWGGDWPLKHKDGPHFQLPWLLYPAITPVK
jgi:peptidoglycan L-alanyl-D-glutamate endopeptidase CwlK